MFNIKRGSTHMAVLELLLSRNMHSDIGRSPTAGQMSLDKATVTFGAAQPAGTPALGSGTCAVAGRLLQASLTSSMPLVWCSSGVQCLEKTKSKVIIKIYCSGMSFH